VNSLPTHDPQLAGPELMPLRILPWVGQPSVKVDLDKVPSLGLGDGSRERGYFVIGV